jgi:hypothetical protein
MAEGADFTARLAVLPPGQRRVVETWLPPGRTLTYRAVARTLGIHIGTVYEHLRRVRLKHPELWAEIQRQRQLGLNARHRAARARAILHTARWYEITAPRRGWRLP